MELGAQPQECNGAHMRARWERRGAVGPRKRPAGVWGQSKARDNARLAAAEWGVGAPRAAAGVRGEAPCEEMKNGKKFRAAADQVEDRFYSLEEAIPLAQKVGYAGFDESVEMTLRLGVNPKHADQMVRGTIVLPHGLGRSRRVLVVASGEKQKEAQDAGADVVGGEEIVERIQGGWLEFDAVIATPDMMRVVGKLGKVLGPRGLMPNPKTGTVTFDVAQAVKEISAGKVAYRVDKAGVVHAPIGKASFEANRLVENAQALIASVVRAKPSAAKGKYVRSVTVSSTMGPGIKVDTSNADALAAQARESDAG